MLMPMRESSKDITHTKGSHFCCGCMITLLIFFFDFVHFPSVVHLITKLSKERIMTLIYLIKLLKPKKNIGKNFVFKILITLPNLNLYLFSSKGKTHIYTKH